MSQIKDRDKSWIFTFNSDEKGEYEFLFNPKEWRETEYAIERSEDDGIIFVFSGDYTFLKDSYGYIDEGYNEYGVLWDVSLKFEYIDNHSKERKTLFENRKLDFASNTQSSEDGNVYKIPLKDSAFYEKIKARENEEIPYSRLVTLDGGTITPYVTEYEDVTVYGQEVETTNELTILESLSVSQNQVYPSMTHSNTLDNWISTTLQDTGGVGPAPNYTAPNEEWVDNRNFFKGLSNQGIIKGTITVRYICNGTSNQTFHLFDYKTLTPAYVTTETGFNNGIGSTSVDIPFEYNFDNDTRLVLFCGSGTQAFKNIYSTINNITVVDKRSSDIIEHVSLFQFHDRILTSITGQEGSFESSVLYTGGKWAHVYVSNGYLYRQYTTEEAQLTGKWKELIENTSRTLGVSYGLITENGVSKIICEDREYFYEDDVSLVVDKIHNNSFAREFNSSQHYSSIVSGTLKKNYEAQSGLKSYETQSNYTTVLSVFETPLDLGTTYQKDGNWMEFSRRLPKVDGETVDSQYDNDVCFMETIYDFDIVARVQRTDEDFDTVNGIDIITTPVNLNLTPARAIYRQGQFIRTGLEKYLGRTLTVDIGFGPEEIFFPTYIKFNKSDVLTKLSTVRSDEGIEVFENKDIDPNNLAESKFTGNIIKALGDISLDEITTIENNRYKKIQIPDEISGENVQGWVLSVSTKPIGDSLTNIELIEAREVTEIDNSMIWNSGESIDWNSGESIDWNQ
jgi:hypothetical protein